MSWYRVVNNELVLDLDNINPKVCTTVLINSLDRMRTNLDNYKPHLSVSLEEKWRFYQADHPRTQPISELLPMCLAGK